MSTVTIPELSAANITAVDKGSPSAKRVGMLTQADMLDVWENPPKGDPFKVFTNTPHKLQIVLTSQATLKERVDAYDLNTECLIRLGGCKSTEQMNSAIANNTAGFRQLHTHRSHLPHSKSTHSTPRPHATFNANTAAHHLNRGNHANPPTQLPSHHIAPPDTRPKSRPTQLYLFLPLSSCFLPRIAEEINQHEGLPRIEGETRMERVVVSPRRTEPSCIRCDAQDNDSGGASEHQRKNRPDLTESETREGWGVPLLPW